MKLFSNIGALMTLSGARKKKGRSVQERDLSLKKKSALIVDKGKIAWVGASHKIPKEFRSQIKSDFDVEGRTVVPGFIDCHTHSVFAGSRSQEYEMRNQGVSYQEIHRRGGGIGSTVKAVKKASEAELQDLFAKRVHHFNSQGVTTIEVKSGYGLSQALEEKMLRSARSSKARVVRTYLGLHSRPKGKPRYVEDVIEKGLPSILKKGLACRADLFIEKGFFTLEEGKRYIQKAHDLGFHVTVHADQLTRTGSTRMAVQMGCRSVDHVVEMNRKDVNLLAESETTAVALPAADYYLKIPYPPVRSLLDQGGRVALATDFNPGSAPTQNIGFVGFLARHEMKMTLPEVYAGFTVCGAHVLGLESCLGFLEKGALADFSVLEGDWTDEFYSVGSTGVIQTFMGGRRIWKKS